MQCKLCTTTHAGYQVAAAILQKTITTWTKDLVFPVGQFLSPFFLYLRTTSWLEFSQINRVSWYHGSICVDNWIILLKTCVWELSLVCDFHDGAKFKSHVWTVTMEVATCSSTSLFGRPSGTGMKCSLYCAHGGDNFIYFFRNWKHSFVSSDTPKPMFRQVIFAH